MSNLFTTEEREALWKAWTNTISDIADGTQRTSDIDLDFMDLMRGSLRDIPLRDALLSYVARNPETRTSFREMFSTLGLGGDAPSLTLLAAIQYIDNEVNAASENVSEVLEREDYSLARLLHQGLAMNAPASMLQRSFSYYTPESLLYETAV